MVLDELASIFVAASVGLIDTNIFLGTGKPIPPPPATGPFLSLIETGGSGSEGTHNSTLLPAYVNPHVQLYARGADYKLTRAVLDAAYVAVFPIRNRLVAGVWWRSVNVLGEIMDLGRDPDSGRINLTLNIRITRRPNVASSS